MIDFTNVNDIEVKKANLTVTKDGKEVTINVAPEGENDDKSRADNAPFVG